MPKSYDATEVNVDFTIPDGEYVLEVINAKEGKSKGGDYQVTVDFKVMNKEHKGFRVNFHRVTFKEPTEPGAGIAVAFLKAIGQPYKGAIEIAPANWPGAHILAWLEAEEYNGKKSMKVKWIKPLEVTTNNEEIPF